MSKKNCRKKFMLKFMLSKKATKFTLPSSQSKTGRFFFSNFCGFLRKSELYLDVFVVEHDELFDARLLAMTSP